MSCVRKTPHNNPASLPGYYIDAAKSGSGAGTFANPYGLADLQVYHSSGASSRWEAGPAIANLQAGDTLYFRGGTYPIQGIDVNFGNTQAGGYWSLGPTTSGTASQPIIIRNYPGESVSITQTSTTYQPTFGNSQNYVRYLGLTINNSSADMTGWHPLPIFQLSDCIGCEIAYCKLVGHTWLADNGDNYEAILLASSTAFSSSDNWIHHNEITGFKNQSNTVNAAGIKVYGSGPAIIEDNYIHDCITGAYEKLGGLSTQPPGYQDFTYRRNYIVNNVGFPIVGPAEAGAVQQATMHIYDNVLEFGLDMEQEQTGSQIYNNLFLTVAQRSGNDSTKFTWIKFALHPNNLDDNRETYLLQIWNNVVFPNGAPAAFIPIQQFSIDFTPLTDPLTPLSYMDYNVYTAAINFYYFNVPYTTRFTQAQFQAEAVIEGLTEGGEQHTTVVAGQSTIYPGVGSGDYTLAAPYQTAGRFGDAVGPRVQISGTGGIMDTTRYGPDAIGEYV